VPKGHNPNRKRKKFEELEKKNGIKNTHTWKIMSEEPGKVTPQDSHKWMGNTFGVKGVKCTTQNERKCEPKRGKGAVCEKGGGAVSGGSCTCRRRTRVP